MDDELDYQSWDTEGQATSPQREMGPLDQLKLYQHAIRKICPLLDPYESAVFMQLVDRITGWRKREARFSQGALMNGDPKVYGGLARVMHRSRLLKALRTLEAKGVIRRRPQVSSKVRIYYINFDIDLEALKAAATPLREAYRRGPNVSERDHPVSEGHAMVSSEDDDVSERDQIEEYSDKGTTTTGIQDKRAPIGPAARTMRLIEVSEKNEEEEEKKEERSIAARPGLAAARVNPLPRKRPLGFDDK